jgi:aldehyde:ferredoxin oxidoreductase
MHGWSGKIIRVDLSGRKITREEVAPNVARDYLGGRGLGIYYLLKELDPLCDPLQPENLLIFSLGPLTGTKAPTAARAMVTTKSPLTGALTCSNTGGYFPTELKKSGLDLLIFQGRASEPVYLWINNDHAELREAAHIWGKTTHETDVVLRQETDARAKVASIGPAGENQVRFAAIMNDKNRAAGRAGVGAVMGSKNLKAIVVKGDGEVALWDPEGFKAANKKYRKKFKDSLEGGKSGLNLYGTAATITGIQMAGCLPTRNCQQGTFENWERIGGQVLTRDFLVTPKACFSCPIGCGRVTKVDDSDFKGQGEGPEYETIYSMGSMCGIDNLAALTKANYLCNELGMDTISMGATLACAMELSERGYLPEADTGKPLKFGDAHALVELTRKTASREEFGEYLAEGSLRLARKYGHPELAMVSKGLEFAGYDPRGEQGMGLAYATSPIGASHMRGDPAYIELLGVPMLIDPKTWRDKPQIVKDWQDVFAVIDAAGLCVFFSVRNLCTPTKDIRPDGILDLVNTATGADYTLEELVRVGERIFNAERMFLLKAGFTGKDDKLPIRILEEPLPDGPAKGMVCHLDEMLSAYYKLRQWGPDGIPLQDKIMELGLN